MSVTFATSGLVGMLEQSQDSQISRFAHQSEEEFAKFLSFYDIQWSYEPVCFPVVWDAAGRVREAFTPDFYLPQFDLYVELTTMKQSLVTRKNRKLRLMRELYPDIRVKILYRKDVRHLMFKHGDDL